MEPWYTSYYFVDIFHLGPIDVSQCIEQNPSELAKRIKWLVSFIINTFFVCISGIFFILLTRINTEQFNNVFYIEKISWKI